MLFDARRIEQKDALFEQLLLFDKITFKVYGENLLIPVLISFFGEKGFDALVEQGAINFVSLDSGDRLFAAEYTGP